MEKVTETIYRSARPTGDELAKWCREIPIQSVLNLTAVRAYDKPLPDDITIPLYRYPLDLCKGPVTDTQLSHLEWRSFMAERPILIHCEHGVDRTGIAVAIFMLNDGYTMDEAIAKAYPKNYTFEFPDTGIRVIDWLRETYGKD